MKYKIGNKVKVFGTDKEVEVVGIEEGVQADVYGTMIDAYKVKGTHRLYVDIYDGTISEI